VVDNVAMRAAALSHGDGNPLFENCLFANNTAFGDYAVVHSSRATFPGPHAQPEFNNCDFVGNRGDALELYAADARLTDCRIRGNSGLGLHATGVSIVQARNCLFERNSGGGLNAESPGTYLNCRFLANDASATFHGGGGAYVSGTPPVSFLNCEFGGNRAGRGGAALVQTIFGPTANAYFRNCTFHGNSASTSSGNLRADLAHITLENCIALGNTGLGGLALHLAQSSATVLYSNLQGGQMGVTQTAGSALNWGAGNSALDPLFVDAIGPDQIAGTTDDDLRLRPTSQLVDAGNPATVIDSAESDLDGHPRILCSRVDMGAYEFGLGDIDCDRAVDLDDFAFWPDCIGGPDSAINPPDCLAFDAQNDSDVDLRDVAGVFLHQSSD
jgi:hypothetical protein